MSTGMNPKDIIPLIDGNIQIGNIPIEPGLTNGENNETGVIGFNTENSEIKEGLIRFDIVFYVKTKNGKVQIIINVEAQKPEPNKYDIINRGIFYVSRLISSQKGKDFVKEKGIEKGKTEIILNMYEEGYSLEQIAKVAKMDKESIEKICKMCQRK